MTQTDLEFESAQRRLIRAVEDAVNAIGLVVAAGACDASKQVISDTLAGRESRHLRSEWVTAIARYAPEEMRRAIARALVEPLGYEVQPKKKLTAEEENRRLKAALKSLGPVGTQALRDSLSE